MQTLNLTITLPDIIKFDDRAALQMQVVYVKSLVESGKINFNDSAQRDAVLEWYLRVGPHIQPTAEENEAAKAEFRRLFHLPEFHTPSTKQERWVRWQKLAANIDREADEHEHLAAQ
ncbi:hypothetical protein [uncultured Hymenobacter sp.]|uniref:hypothetical protein n=1 Tax=uncultured Hymenobacter sp. TaxID=170016 RepID=UPI0035CACB1D